MNIVVIGCVLVVSATPNFEVCEPPLYDGSGESARHATGNCLEK